MSLNENDRVPGYRRNLEKSSPLNSVPLAAEFEEFLTVEQDPLLEDVISNDFKRETAFKRLHSKVGRDLVQSPAHMALVYVGLSVVGYMLSLLLCAQWSLGFSPLSHKIASYMHTLPEPVCPLVCGAVFTAIPFFLSCFFLNRFQHRYLLRRLWWLFAVIPFAAVSVMLLLPPGLQHTHATPFSESTVLQRGNAEWLVLWTVASLLTPFVLEFLLYLFVKPKRYLGPVQLS